jgi:hypothetical protein
VGVSTHAASDFCNVGVTSAQVSGVCACVRRGALAANSSTPIREITESWIMREKFGREVCTIGLSLMDETIVACPAVNVMVGMGFEPGAKAPG